MKGFARILPMALVGTALSVRAEVDTVRACVEQNAPRISSVQSLALTVRDREGDRSESRMKLYWRRLPGGERRVLLRLLAPADLLGAAVLVESLRRRRPVVHLYLPELGRPQRVKSRAQFESFLGRADLGIEEVRQLLDPIGREDLRILDGAAEAAGRAVWALEAREPDGDARYPRIVTFIDREYCVPLRTEFYDHEDRVRKLLRVDPARVERAARSWVPRHLVFVDLESGTETVLRIEEVEIDVPLAPSLLSVKALAAGALAAGARPALSVPPPEGDDGDG